MKIAFFSTQKYDRDFFLKENDRFNFDLVFFEVHLKQETLELAKGYEAICVFVNDKIDQAMLKELHKNGTKLIVLRCAGFNNIDIKAAQEIALTASTQKITSTVFAIIKQQTTGKTVAYDVMKVYQV